MLKAIETKYKGYRFRSRLEARWAVFFDALGIVWEYEFEGYDLGIFGWYLPDFWLPKNQVWIEIKPIEPSQDEKDKAWALTNATNQVCSIVCGTPESEIVYLPDPPVHDRWLITSTTETIFSWWVWCDISFCRHFTSDDRSMICPTIRAAYEAARSARFEHGERS